MGCVWQLVGRRPHGGHDDRQTDPGRPSQNDPRVCRSAAKQWLRECVGIRFEFCVGQPTTHGDHLHANSSYCCNGHMNSNHREGKFANFMRRGAANTGKTEEQLQIEAQLKAAERMFE